MAPRKKSLKRAAAAEAFANAGADTGPKAATEATATAPSRDAVAAREASGEGQLDSFQYTFPIVGIGASAGGLGAYEAFFSALPRDLDIQMAFVLVQHLAPNHKSLLVDLVARYTRMQVSEVEDGMRVEPNRAYVIPPNRDMTLAGGRLRLSPPSEPRGHRLPIDLFFRSLAHEQGERAICIVLSGTGSDGTLGVRAVKGEGGMAMVQDPTTTDHDGMPRNAIATGLVDYVLPPSEMPAQLLAYARQLFESTRASRALATSPDGTTLKRITSLLRTQTGHDFAQYKPTTLLRRVERRMALQQIADPDSYLRYAREHPAEMEGLFKDLLIGVTSFFRDPEAFAALEEKLLPRLLGAKSPDEPFRVWVCGCSTGEEAYSLAIVLQEHLERAKQPVRVQIFATDIDHRAIEQARSGIYPVSIAADVTPDRLARFFVHEPARDAYRIQKLIRDMIVFSEQDVIRDPPFSKLDLISCRNLLIYLNVDAQRKLIPLFHYSLVPGGGLFLGSSETVGEFTRLFTPLDRKARVYMRESLASEPARLRGFVSGLREPNETPRIPLGRRPADPVSSWRHLTEQAVLAHYAEAAVLINSRGDILYVLGKTGKYLEPASGDAAFNIVAMAREGLRRELAIALQRAVAHKVPARHAGLKVLSNGGYVVADLTVRPVNDITGADGDLYLAILEERPSGEETAGSSEPMEPVKFGNRVAELEQELKTKEDYLQATIEEMETTNEELRSTNEEMQSINEELQSTNEELETSKEELQSVNEELSTVNAELQDRIAELSRVNNDMNNLLAGTGVGTIFVDTSLRILRFTPSVTQVINLIPTDVGRPVAHIVANLVGYDQLVEDARAVLDSLVPREAEVLTKSGVWFLMRIRPYRTIENKIEGVVLTFVDVSERKRAEEALRETEARFHNVVDQALAGVVETDPAGRFVFVNDGFSEMTGYTRTELLATSMQELTHPEDAARTNALFDALVAGGPGFSVEKRYRREDGTAVWVAERVGAVRDTAGAVTATVAVSFDLSERRRIQVEAAADDTRLAAELDGLSRLEGVGQLSLSATNRQAVFEEILDAAISISRADMAILQLRGPNGALRVVAQRGCGDSYVRFWNQTADQANENVPFVQGPVVVDDVITSRLLAGTPALEAHIAAGVRALHSVPLVTREGDVVGILATHFREARRPEAWQVRMFDMLGRQVTGILARDTQDSPSPRRTPRSRGREAVMK